MLWTHLKEVQHGPLKTRTVLLLGPHIPPRLIPVSPNLHRLLAVRRLLSHLGYLVCVGRLRYALAALLDVAPVGAWVFPCEGRFGGEREGEEGCALAQSRERESDLQILYAMTRARLEGNDFERNTLAYTVLITGSGMPWFAR